MICKVLIILFAVCMPAMSAAYKLEPFPSIDDILRALQVGHEPNELVVYPSIEDIESARVQIYPSIENIIRAHLRPDSPPVQNDIPINDHHLRRLTALSIRQQTFRNFLIFRGGNLDSFRMYNCYVEDFNSIAFLLGIKELHVRNCRIRDISPIAKLRGLTNLSLTDNDIEDISALSRCKQLTWLDLRNNKIDSVSALKQLHKLVYVDLRNNPLGANSDDGDIQLIKVNNPGVRILLGKQSISKIDLDQQLSARAKIAEFALCARLQYKDGLFPLLPNLSDDISAALKCLIKGDNKEYLADIAALLMKYVIEIESYYRPGPVFSRGQEPLIDAFIDRVGLEVGDEGIAALTIGRWICNNRDKLAPSLVLDIQIERRHDLHIKLKQRGIYGSSDKIK